MNDPIVQGFEFQSVAEFGPLAMHNGNICQIIRRATYPEISEQEIMDSGPAFLVKFGDGYETVAHSSELRPWYPT